MAGEAFHYKGWWVEILDKKEGRKALIYRPTSPLPEIQVPDGPDRRVGMQKAMTLIDGLLGGSEPH